MFLPWILQAALVTAVPAQQEIAEVHELVKRQATPTYAQSCVVYSQVIAIGAATTTSCTDATAAGPNYVQSCTGLIGFLPLGYNCGSVFTAVSSCPVTTTTTVGGLIFRTTDTIFITGTNCVTPTYPARPKSTTVMATTSSAAATPSSTSATPAATTTKASSTSLAATTTRAPSTSLAAPTTSLAPTSTSIAAQAATTTSIVLSSSVQSTSTKVATTSSSLPMVPTTSSAAVLTSTIASTTSVPSVPTTSLAPSSSSAAMSTSSAAALTSSVIATSSPAAVTSSAVAISSSTIKTSSSAAITSVLSTISSAAATSSALPTMSSAAVTTSALPTTSSAAATSSALPATSSSAVISSTLLVSSSSVATTSSTIVQASASQASSVVSSSASAAPTAGLPRTAKNGATYIGCFQDGIDQRTLQQRTNDVNNVEECVSQCGSAGFDRAGVEYYTQCFCGYASAGYNGQPQIDDGICSVPCNDPTQTCGNGNAMQIYAIPNALVNPSPVANTPTPSPTAGLPRLSRNGGQYLGCFRDDVSQRALSVRVGDVGTVEACISSCQSAGYALAGLEYFYQCFCGNGGTNGQPQIDDGSCNAPCNDDKSQTCGGGNALQLYSVPQGAGAPTIPTSISTSTGSGAYQGCYSDDVNFRTLPNRVADAGSVDQCVNSCINAGYTYAGIEYTRECYCGNSVSASLIDNAQCQKYTCTENGSQKCGGDNAIQVYSLQSSSAPPAATGTWSYVGCLQDFYPTTRTLQGYTVTSNSMTQQFCKSTCQAKGFTYAGVEYSGECFCDNQIHNNPQTLTSCTMACSGDSSQLCGGSNAIQVYTLNALSSSVGSGPAATAGPASPTILQVTSGGATYNGCYTDSVNARALRNRLSDVTGSDPVSTCMSACKAAGYTLGAVEYGRECFCDVSINNGHSLTSDGACNMICDGNSQQYCGNGNTAQVYNL